MGDASPGPSLPGKSTRCVLVTTEDDFRKEFCTSGGPFTLPLPVASRADNKVIIISLDEPTLAVLPNGDPRPLLLRIERLYVAEP